MIIVMHKVAKMNFRDRRNSKPRILDAKYVPTRSSKTSIKGAMATCFAGARAPIAWRLNNGKAVNAEKAINPITMFTTIRIHAVRQSNFVSRAAMKREIQESHRRSSSTQKIKLRNRRRPCLVSRCPSHGGANKQSDIDCHQLLVYLFSRNLAAYVNMSLSDITENPFSSSR